MAFRKPFLFFISHFLLLFAFAIGLAQASGIEVYFNTGKLYFHGKNYPMARDYFEKVIIQLPPKDSAHYKDTVLYLALCYEKMNNYPEAIDYYQIYLPLDHLINYQHVIPLNEIENKINELSMKVEEIKNKYGSFSVYYAQEAKRGEEIVERISRKIDERYSRDRNNKKASESAYEKESRQDNLAALSPREIYKKYKTAVVSITTLEKYNRKYGGSGFFISPNGLLITNYHVIRGSKSIAVTTFNKNTYEARVIKCSENLDLALLKIDEGNLEYLKLEPLIDHDDIVTEPVVAIGNPLGLGFSVTRGIVSQVRTTDDSVWIQTDTAISPGSSGGPLIDTRGRVIGVNTRKVIREDAEGIGFAIASSIVNNWLEK